MIVNPGDTPLAFRLTVHFPGAGPASSLWPAQHLLRRHRMAAGAIGEPVRVRHFVDRVDVFGASDLLQARTSEQIDDRVEVERNLARLGLRRVLGVDGAGDRDRRRRTSARCGAPPPEPARDKTRYQPPAGRRDGAIRGDRMIEGIDIATSPPG